MLGVETDHDVSRTSSAPAPTQVGRLTLQGTTPSATRDDGTTTMAGSPGQTATSVAKGAVTSKTSAVGPEGERFMTYWISVCSILDWMVPQSDHERNRQRHGRAMLDSRVAMRMTPEWVKTWRDVCDQQSEGCG